MIEVGNTEIVFSFPDEDEGAILRVHFCLTEMPEAKIPICRSANLVQFGTAGRIVIHLRPHLLYGKTYGDRGVSSYPFAVLVSVDGRNAITGDYSATLVRSPQNYFASPPQGGIDGYFTEGRVLPFQVRTDPPIDPPLLRIKVFPAKKEILEYWSSRTRLLGSVHYSISGLTLRHGGERQCEPIYEDMCCIGDWNGNRSEEIILRLAAP